MGSSFSVSHQVHSPDVQKFNQKVELEKVEVEPKIFQEIAHCVNDFFFQGFAGKNLVFFAF